MANSKSNIYPIQLQGAELNLNKYDAEIKQYSGFNKNNSPFVGGCLSNVFHKNETIENANDNNTYIDENGDVYQVDTEGFYKNGVKIKDLAAPFVNLKKLPNLGYPHRYFSENVVATLINKAIYLNGEFIADMDDSQTDDDLLNKHITGISVKHNDNVYFIFACKGFTKFRYKVLNLATGETAYDYTSVDQNDLKNVDITFPVTIFFDDTTGKVVVYFSRNEIVSSIERYYRYNYVSDDFLAEGTIGKFDSSGFMTEVNKASNQELVSLSHGIGTIWLLGYPLNKIVISNNLQTDLEATKFYCYSFDYDFSITSDDYVILDYQHCQSFQASSPSWNNGGRSDFIYRTADVTPLIFGFSLYVCNPDKNRFVYFHPQSIFLASVQDGVLTQPAMFFEYFNNYILFFNNGNLSSIAVKDGDCNAVLISNWNLVNPYSLSFTHNLDDDYYSLCYQEDGDYYLITLDNKPKLRKVIDQIVLNNITTNYNTYFLRRQTDKWGLFAPGFNGSIRRLGSNNEILTYYRVTSIAYNYFIGLAVNEYKQEKNPSIIINPILYLDYLKSHMDMVSLGFVGIDYYQSLNNDPKCIYKYTWVPGDTRYDRSLKGVAFPSDTNGNVQYSLSLFSEVESEFGNMAFLKTNNVMYPLIKGGENEPIMAYYLASGIENISRGFIIQGQFYGIIKDNLYSLQFMNGVLANILLICDVSNLQFVGNTPYEALFFSKTNRCLYSFTGANILNQKQLVDKINEVRNYLYNPATQTVFLITDIGVLFYGLFGMFLLEYTNITNIFLLDNGIVMSDNSGNYHYIKYYLDEGDTDYLKKNIQLETCFYGMNNQTITINDCLYFRLFSEEHEEGELKVSATTISLSGRKTEETTFKINANDWDKITHTIYLRYQPKTQRGLGVSFSIDSPFKIASLSVGSQPDAILVDKISKGAINAPFNNTSSQTDW